MRQKIHSYIGFAKRSRELVSGTTSCINGLEKGKIRLLLIAGDTAESSMEKLVRAAERSQTTYRICFDRDSLSEMAGEYGRSVFGITGESLAKAILKEIDQGEGRPDALEQEGLNG